MDLPWSIVLGVVAGIVGGLVARAAQRARGEQPPPITPRRVLLYVVLAVAVSGLGMLILATTA